MVFMRLTDALAPQVPTSVRERGRRYYQAGAVEFVHGDASEVRARVAGTREYAVVLTLSEGELAISCTCPYFASSAVCKHIWATLLGAEDRDHLTDHAAEDFSSDDPVPGDYDAWWGDGSEQRPGVDEAVPRAPRWSNPPPSWTTRVDSIARARDNEDEATRSPRGSEILYLFDPSETRSRGQLTLQVVHRILKRDGSWGKPKPQRIDARTIPQLNEPSDRQIFSMLLGSQQPWSGYGYYTGYGAGGVASGSRVAVPASMTDVLVPLICRTGRAYTKAGAPSDDPTALSWKDGPSWELWLEAEHDPDGDSFVVGARLQRGDETISLDTPQMLLTGGFVFGHDGVVERLDDLGAFGWISSIRKHGPLVIPVAQSDEFLAQLLELPNLPKLDLPAALRYEEVALTPRPRLQLHPSLAMHRGGNHRLRGVLSFDYGGEVIAADEAGRGVFQASRRRFLLRDRTAEAEAAGTITSMGLRLDRAGGYELAARHLPRVVRALVDAGWHVEAEGRLYKPAAATRMKVRSGIDWFELSGEVEFGTETASLPELMAALRRGESFVPLGDGTMGLLPEQWLEKHRLLAGIGNIDGDGLRFKRTQAGLLDALLASQPDVSFDKAFERARDQMRTFKGVEEAKEPAGFVGELRAYQREGLGWMRFLQRFGFGGCLADDMGLGKTVQVLALLEWRRQLRARSRAKNKKPPSLVVVPRSLVFNWYQEAERFAPKLKVLNHTGARLTPGEHFDGYDVVLTTYGTLRRDVLGFDGVKFDYCILDEAQAIKNPNTVTAKAARLIQADHRLALSGTPIENHLGELWSLFEFLNPGMLGSASAFDLGLNGKQGPDEQTRQVLAQALRPYILRRTKDQVAADLPPKTEQILHCELGRTQRRYYDQLKDHFRRDLLTKVDRDGMQRSKMLVLEALLRLRQAACHPGLIDPSKAAEPSAKLDVLIPQLVEVAEEGHKALVFSQFTKLLAVVRDRLEREGVIYEYLDGRTRDRQAKVERFRSDPGCPVFLISLKAGGLGLNLTEAEYVFLLDPWWNPAVEAQAIDRTHRIGQTRSVFAYRLIARDTIEEKVLQLQDSKRTLADAIITTDNSLIKNLRREDLELLFA
jgi:superfamily II DNA or RNA helicase